MTKIRQVLAAVWVAIVQVLAAPMRLLANADRDKLQHHIAGGLVGAVAALAAVGFGLGPLQAGVAALTFGLVAGYIKELLDWRANRAARRAGEPELRGVEKADAIATWGGALPVALPLIALGLLL